MTMGSTITSSNGISAAAELRRTSNAPEVGAEPLATVGFHAVLDVARGALGARSRHAGAEFASPEQMFEPAQDDSRERRAHTLREEFRRDVQSDTGVRYDRSSVASRARLAGTERPTESSAAPVTNDAKLPPSSEAARTALRSAEAFPVEPARNAERPAPPPGVPGVVAGAKESSPLAAKVDTTPIAAASRSATPLAPPTESGERNTVAQKIGQVLGAARAGGVESAKATAPVGSLPGTPEPKASERPTVARDAASQTARDGRPDRTSSGAEAARTSFDELVRSIRMRGGTMQSTARMHLNPPELGRVRIDVRMEGERLQIHVLTANQEATQVLTERSADLRAALAEQGILVDRFEVGTDAPGLDDGALGGRGSEQTPNQQTAQDRTGAPATERRTAQTVAAHTDIVVEPREVVAERRLDIKV